MIFFKMLNRFLYLKEALKLLKKVIDFKKFCVFKCFM